MSTDHLGPAVSGRDTGLMMRLTCEYFRRGADTKPAILDAAYCLDATDILPAGSTYADQVKECRFPMETTVERA